MMSNEDGWVDPKEIEQPLTLHRVARPLRPVKYIPTKSIVFYSKNTPPSFTYDIKIKLPINKNSIVVQVLYVGLNPVDLKIFNSYTTNMNSFTGLGREFVGKITHMGSNVDRTLYKQDDILMGTFFHPNLGKGSLQTSIELNIEKDVFFHKPDYLNLEEASSTTYCLGASYSLLSSIPSLQKLITPSNSNDLIDEPNILINGGGSNMGMFTIQLLKYYYKIRTKKITIICSDYSKNIIKSEFPDLIDDLIFINYLNGKNSVKLRKMIKDCEIVEYTTNNSILSTPYEQGKYDLIIDYIGGYDLIEHSDDIFNKNAQYITTVGDYKFNYFKDIYSSSSSTNFKGVNRSLWSKMTWNFTYTFFQFDPNLKYSQSYYHDWKNQVEKLLINQTIKKTIIDKVYDWKKYDEAFKYLQKGHAHGKIVLKLELF